MTLAECYYFCKKKENDAEPCVGFIHQHTLTTPGDYVCKTFKAGCVEDASNADTQSYYELDKVAS